MKYKILIIILLGVLFTSLIYFHTSKETKNILALGDSISIGMTSYHINGYDYNDYLRDYLNSKKELGNYYKNFNESDETASNLLTKINNNIENTLEKTKLKQAIKEANIITIALGMDELNNYAKKNNLGTTKINGFLNKYEQVLKNIRSINNKKIYLIGLYPTNLVKETKINKINEELKKLSKRYNLEYIDIENIREQEYFFASTNDYYLNYKGQEYIFNKIKDSMEKNNSKII